MLATYPPAKDGLLTHIEITYGNDCRDNLKRVGYHRIDVDIAGIGRQCYLWFRLAQAPLLQPITVVAVSHDGDTELALEARGLICIERNLNRNLGGNRVLLWYAREVDGKPLGGLAVTTGDDSLTPLGYVRVECNLRRGSLRAPVFLWYRQAGASSSPSP